MTPIRSAAVALLLLLLAGCGGDDSPTITPGASATSTSTSASTSGGAGAAVTLLSVTVRGGSVEGASRQRASLNQPVTIRVTSDAADQVHVHGYDKTFDVAAGRSGEVTFVANIPGVFEVEFERSHKVLFTLEVR